MFELFHLKFFSIQIGDDRLIGILCNSETHDPALKFIERMHLVHIVKMEITGAELIFLRIFLDFISLPDR